ncbi:unnamed protein product, partial [Trichogramma brassicae]
RRRIRRGGTSCERLIEHPSEVFCCGRDRRIEPRDVETYGLASRTCPQYFLIKPNSITIIARNLTRFVEKNNEGNVDNRLRMNIRIYSSPTSTCINSFTWNDSIKKSNFKKRSIYIISSSDDEDTSNFQKISDTSKYVCPNKKIKVEKDTYGQSSTASSLANSNDSTYRDSQGLWTLLYTEETEDDGLCFLNSNDNNLYKLMFSFKELLEYDSLQLTRVVALNDEYTHCIPHWPGGAWLADHAVFCCIPRFFVWLIASGLGIDCSSSGNRVARLFQRCFNCCHGACYGAVKKFTGMSFVQVALHGNTGFVDASRASSGLCQRNHTKVAAIGQSLLFAYTCIRARALRARVRLCVSTAARMGLIRCAARLAYTHCLHSEGPLVGRACAVALLLLLLLCVCKLASHICGARASLVVHYAVSTRSFRLEHNLLEVHQLPLDGALPNSRKPKEKSPRFSINIKYATRHCTRYINIYGLLSGTPAYVFVSEKECREIRQGASRRKPSISRCGLIVYIDCETEEKISLACSTRFRPGDNFRLNAKLSAPFMMCMSRSTNNASVRSVSMQIALYATSSSELTHPRSSYGLPARATSRCIIIHVLQFLRASFFALACLFFPDDDVGGGGSDNTTTPQRICCTQFAFYVCAAQRCLCASLGRTSCCRSPLSYVRVYYSSRVDGRAQVEVGKGAAARGRRVGGSRNGAQDEGRVRGRGRARGPEAVFYPYEQLNEEEDEVIVPIVEHDEHAPFVEQPLRLAARVLCLSIMLAVDNKTRIFPIVTLLKSKKFKTLITVKIVRTTKITKIAITNRKTNGIRKRADTSARGRNRPERGRRGVGAASPDSTAQRRNRLERDRRGVGAASPDSTVRITKDICPLIALVGAVWNSVTQLLLHLGHRRRERERGEEIQRLEREREAARIRSQQAISPAEPPASTDSEEPPLRKKRQAPETPTAPPRPTLPIYPPIRTSMF